MTWSQLIGHQLLFIEIPAAVNDVTALSGSRSVEVVINGLTGMIDALRVNERDVLLSRESLESFGDHSPSRIHLHRASTDNDKYGYQSAWAAVGLTSDMVYRPTGGFDVSPFVVAVVTP